MKQYGLIGYGALGRQVEAIIREIHFNEQVSFVYFDDQAFKDSIPFSEAFINYRDEKHANLNFVISLGYKHPDVKKQILDSLNQLGRSIPAIIHPSSYISPSAKIGKAVIIYAMCNVDQHVIIEDGAFLNNSVVISHDSVVGSCSFLAPGVVLSGNVSIGAKCFLGSGTVVANDIELGESSIAGIGSVLTKSFPTDSSLIGNPARQLGRKFKLH